MATTETARPGETPGDDSSSAPKNPFAALGLFLRQVIAELSKVVTPTRKELLTYFSVVLAFVLVMMLFVAGLDYVFRILASWLFAASGE